MLSCQSRSREPAHTAPCAPAPSPSAQPLCMPPRVLFGARTGDGRAMHDGRTMAQHLREQVSLPRGPRPAPPWSLAPALPSGT